MNNHSRQRRILNGSRLLQRRIVRRLDSAAFQGIFLVRRAARILKTLGGQRSASRLFVSFTVL